MLALRRRGQAKLHRWRKVIQNAPPLALVPRTAPVALVDHDEVKEVGRITCEDGLALSRHESLEDREKDAGIRRDPTSLPQAVRIDPGDGIGGECGKRVIGLIGKDVAVGKEQDARAA